MTEWKIALISDTRSGSTLISETLALGLDIYSAGEYFLEVDSADLGERSAHVTRLMEALRSRQSFILKVMYHDLELLRPPRTRLAEAPRLLSQLVTVVPDIRIIHLTRRDTIAAAYSELRAVKTGVFHISAGQAKRPRYAMDETELAAVMDNALSRQTALYLARKYLSQYRGHLLGELDYSDIEAGIEHHRLRAFGLKLANWNRTHTKIVDSAELNQFLRFSGRL